MNRDIRTGLITAGLMIAGSLALVGLTKAGLIHGDRDEISTRSINILIGLMTASFASNGAKQLRRRLVDMRNPELEQSLRRSTAWTLATGGALYSLAWLLAPYDYAAYIAMAGLGGAVLIVMARCFLTRTRVV